MTERKRPGIKVPDIKVEGEDEGNALFVMRLVQQPVLPQDVYSVAEVARLLGVKPIKIYHYAKDAVNPLPLRKWRNGSRGSFVIREELIDWLREVTDLPKTSYPDPE